MFLILQYSKMGLCLVSRVAIWDPYLHDRRVITEMIITQKGAIFHHARKPRPSQSNSHHVLEKNSTIKHTITKLDLNLAG